MTYSSEKTIKPIKAFVSGQNVITNVVKTKLFQLAYPVINQPVANVHQVVLK